jgi:hypothetical protein
MAQQQGVPPELGSLIDRALQALLTEAEKQGVLKPPYGKAPMPDPSSILKPLNIDDDEPEPVPGDDGLADDDEDDSDLLNYKYEYGFNPLVFIGEWLQANDPVMLEQQKLQELKAAAIAAEALKAQALRNTAFAELQVLVHQRRSGVLFGPVIGAVTADGAVFWVKACRAVSRTCAGSILHPKSLYIAKLWSTKVLSSLHTLLTTPLAVTARCYRCTRSGHTARGGSSQGRLCCCRSSAHRHSGCGHNE